jgi:hypothetical protein
VFWSVIILLTILHPEVNALTGPASRAH